MPPLRDGCKQMAIFDVTCLKLLKGGDIIEVFLCQQTWDSYTIESSPVIYPFNPLFGDVNKMYMAVAVSSLFFNKRLPGVMTHHVTQ